MREDNEAEYSKRYNVQLPDEFLKSFKYSPPKLIGGIRVESRITYQDAYDNNYNLTPFSVWVFDNQDDIDIDEWFELYSYYPFRWDHSIPSITGKIRPRSNITIGGILGKTSRPDEGMQYIYLLQDKRMILIQIWEEYQSKGIGSLILSTFRFLPEHCGFCPVYTPPHPDFCKDGEIVSGGQDECGCPLPPKCENS